MPAPSPDPAPAPGPSPAPGTPTIFITNPANSIVRARDSVTIDVSIGNSGPNATWTLYRTATPFGGIGLTAIVEDLPATTTSYTWNTAAVAPGEYFFYAILKTGSATSETQSNGSVLVSHPMAGNAEPTVSLGDPFSAGNTAIKLPANITYALADADAGDVAGLTVKIEHYRFATNTWTTIVDGHAHATSYTWNDPMAVEAIDYRLRITVSDTRGGLGIARMTHGPLGVTHTDYRYDTNMKPIFQARCGGSNCHDAGAAFSGVYRWDIWNETTKGNVGKRDRILYRGLVDTFPMPPLNDLDDAQRALYRAKLQLFEWQGWLKN